MLFVHGTGVREASYKEGFAAVRDNLDRMRPGLEVRGCFWGREQGASMALDGDSVPRYRQSRGGTREDDDEIAVWDVLYGDPWYELRLLGLQSAGEAGLGVGLAPSELFLADITEYEPSPEVLDAFAARGLEKDFAEALRAVVRAPELQDAAATVDEDGFEHRRAVARAVMAMTHTLASDRGLEVSGIVRDALLASLGDDLYTEGRSLKGLLGKALLAPVGWRGRRRRGAWGDAALPALGDILRYQARGQGVRDQIRRTVENTPGDRITLIAHSLGGIACVDLLVQEPLERVDQLITVGSQAPYFYEIGALVSLEHPETLPAHFPAKWLNIYDERDFLSYQAGKVFPDRASDHRVDNRQPFPWAHTTYWSNPEVWDAVETWLS
ncbi:esterase/lipase family protein [Streptomyces sp. NPDC004050]